MIEKNKKTFQIRYGRSASYKSISITCQDQAMRMYEKLVTFAQRHNLQWTVALNLLNTCSVAMIFTRSSRMTDIKQQGLKQSISLVISTNPQTVIVPLWMLQNLNCPPDFII